MRYPLGVVAVTYGLGRSPVEVALGAAGDGFEFVDGGLHWPAEGLALPVYDRFSMKPVDGYSSGPWPTWTWEQVVSRWQAAPECRLEPWGGCVINSNEASLAIVREVPGLRLLVDVGHVVGWGGDPIELLPHAGHVQLRQARPGQAQCGDADGDVDFPAILAALDDLGYAGRLSIEYFDLPDQGWPLDDPRAQALELARRLRSLMD